MRGQAIDLIDAEDGIGFEEGDIPFDFVAVSVGLRLVKRLAYTTVLPVSPLRTCAPSSLACLNVIQIGEQKPRAMASDQSSKTLMPV
jgi:hypothetical protein